MHATYGVSVVDLAAGTAAEPESYSKPMTPLVAVRPRCAAPALHCAVLHCRIAPYTLAPLGRWH